jgi:hypothetical protein
MIRRLRNALRPHVATGLDLRLAHAGLSTSPAPVLSWLHIDTNPRLDHCPCCERQWGPADCPVSHDGPCPECMPCA